MKRLLFDLLAYSWGFCRGVREGFSVPLDWGKYREQDGYVWAPYVPVNAMPREGFEVPEGAKTRYSECVVRPEYFGQIEVALGVSSKSGGR